jgi:hypothetical protein
MYEFKSMADINTALGGIRPTLTAIFPLHNEDVGMPFVDFIDLIKSRVFDKTLKDSIIEATGNENIEIFTIGTRIVDGFVLVEVDYEV